MPLHRPSTITHDRPSRLGGYGKARLPNPLKGLAMSRIVAYEDAAERGQHADLQWRWRLMAQRCFTVQAAIACRRYFID